MKNFAWLINSGYDAVKAVNCSTKVIVHLANCENNTLYRWMFDGLKANGAKWDVVGASIYPTQTGNGDWFAMDNLCYDNLADMLKKMAAIPNGKGLGVFYWEPESYNGWQNYSLGLMDNSGKPTYAMDAFLLNY